MADSGDSINYPLLTLKVAKLLQLHVALQNPPYSHLRLPVFQYWNIQPEKTSLVLVLVMLV